MSTLQFKTTITCGNCVQRITPFLEEINEVTSWSVDTTSEDKILTIETDTIEATQIVKVIEDAGFDIEAV